MDPFEPIPVDPPPPVDHSGLSEEEKTALQKPTVPYYDAADVGLTVANAAAFIALTGIGSEMEKSITGAVEAYGDPLIGSSDMIDDVVSRATDSPGGQAELSDGCSGCALAALVLMTAGASTAFAYAL